MKFLHKGDTGFMRRTLCPAENQARACASIGDTAIRDARWEWERHIEITDDWNASARGDEDAAAFFAFAAREMESEKTPLGSLLRKVRRIFRKR
jgi:hypothetical protein